MEARVFSAVPGLEIRIDTFGTATTDRPVIVPDHVADELEATEPRVRVERVAAASAKKKASKGTPAAEAPASNGSPSDGGKE